MQVLRALAAPATCMLVFLALRSKENMKERTSFLKKRSKKLLSISPSAFPDGLSPNEQKFFGSFFQKRIAFFG
jgi:hypothetical protein